MDSSINTTNLNHPNVSQDLLASIPLSEYAKKNNFSCEKAIFGKKKNIARLPPVKSADILCYLVLETSYYTKEQFNNYQSLEAYNQLISGFITSVQGHKRSNKFVVLPKVRHSQRMNDALISVWIITEDNRVIVGAHCFGCKAGLAESCSHVACILYYPESWTKINGKLACMQMKCQWILPPFVKDVEYARVRDINFKSAKKLMSELDDSVDNLSNGYEDNLCIQLKAKENISAPTKVEMDTFFGELSLRKTKPVVLSVVQPYADSYVLSSRHIPTVPNLFDAKYLHLSYPELPTAGTDNERQLMWVLIQLLSTWCPH